MAAVPRLGLELKGVIADSRLADGGDSMSSRQNFLSTPPLPGAIEAITWLNSVWCFRKQITIICELEVNHRVIAHEWLNYVKFFQRSGLDRHQLRFVASPAEKAALAHTLQMTHFVDSKTKSIACMHHPTYRFCIDPHDFEHNAWQRIRRTHIGPQLIRVQTWGSLMPLLLSSIN